MFSFPEAAFYFPRRITLYDYQAMCRANKESSDGAHGLLDVSTRLLPRDWLGASAAFMLCDPDFRVIKCTLLKTKNV